MSVTKSENETCKLISPVDVNTDRVSCKSSKCSNKSSKCSCSDCDSISCFEKRNKAGKGQCQCGICKNPKTCLSLWRKAGEEKKDCNHTENVPKRIIRETVTRETVESLKKVTETMYAVSNNENFEMFKEDRLKINSNKETPMHDNIAANVKISKENVENVTKTNEIERLKQNEEPILNNTKSNLKNTKESKNSDKNTDKKECCKHRPVAHAPSKDKSGVDKNDKPKENNIIEDDTATKLSALVMNVPYEDLHETVSSNQLPQHNPLSNLNIFKRIKEIYDACSCKVCECIASKPLPIKTEICKCKPCDCPDCANIRRKIDEKIRRLPHSGCPCIRCDRKDCQGIVKNASEQQMCDCKPCECVQCLKNFPKPCSCEPCQCADCKSLRHNRTTKTVKLAQIDQVFQEEFCQCSPCECIECKQIYNRTNPTVMCSTSTQMARYRNCRCENCPIERCKLGETETCKCERYSRSMQKYLKNNYNDYDIRTVIVNDNGPFKTPNDIFKNHNTIALFASFKNNFTNSLIENNRCKCVDCECIQCNGSEEETGKDTLFGSSVRVIRNTISFPTSNSNACKCSPCECEICSKRNMNTALESRCRCDVCDCLHCDKSYLATCSTAKYDKMKGMSKIAKPIKLSTDKNSNCKCDSCECRNCNEFISCTSRSSTKYYSHGNSTGSKATVRRSRKVLLVSPSISETHINPQKKCGQRESSNTPSIQRSIEGIFQQKNTTSCHSINRIDYALPSCSEYYEGNAYLSRDSDFNTHNTNDFSKKLQFNLNNLPSKTTSNTTSNPGIISKINTFKGLKIASRTENLCKAKSRDFNVIHEPPVKITSNDSEESVPVWYCYNKNVHSNDVTQNFNVYTEKIISKEEHDVSKRLISDITYGIASTSCDTHEKKNSNKNIEYSQEKDVVKGQILERNPFKRYSQQSHNKNYDSIFKNEHDVLHFASQKCGDPLSTILGNKRDTEITSIVNNNELSKSYERATKVLQEAKAFSSKLVKMLDSFEKANREFESTSKRFKNLHKSLLAINETEDNKDSAFHKPSISANISSFENTSEKFKVAKENVIDENEAEKEYEQYTNKLQGYSDNDQHTERSDPLKTTPNTDNYTDPSVVDVNTANDSICAVTLNFQQSGKLQREDRTTINSDTSLSCKSKELSFSATSQISDKSRVNEETTVTNNPEDTAVAKRLSMIMGKLNATPTAIDASVLTDDLLTNATGYGKQEDTNTWNIFRKNLYLNTGPVEMNRNFFGLETDIKEAIQAIMRSSNQYAPPIVPRASAALATLQSEVENLLTMPLSNNDASELIDCNNLRPRSILELHGRMSSTASSQTYDRRLDRADKEVYFNNEQSSGVNCQRCKHLGVHIRSYSPFTRKMNTASRTDSKITDRDTSSINKSKSSCDALKASFIGLRRVSDHTVLVKWSVPKRVKDVQGYELLVDGRAVQKIFSPTRSMAVVTCLPNADRVLLTIRTITDNSECGHPPATSIVYRPRNR